MSTRRCFAARQFLFGFLGSLLLTPGLLGADDPAAIREVYWQVLPKVSWVYVDRAGRPWFQTAGGDIAGTIGKKSQHISGKQTLLLGDSSGRIWINTRYSGRKTTKCFDGKDWSDIGFRASNAFEDSAGRVFLTDATHVHVLDGKTWSKQRVSAGLYSPNVYFAEDPKGRTWFWGQKQDSHWGKHAGTQGAWSYDRGKWTSHDRNSGLTIADIQVIVPLAGDRFLVLGTPQNERGKYIVWSPSRKLNAKEQDVFGVKPPGPVGYAGVDLDGLHHFIADGLHKRDGASRSTKGRIVLSPKGKARLLSRARGLRAGQLPRGLYENRSRIFGRLSDIPPAVPCRSGEAICRDSLGRIYFRWKPGVGVVWPKFEKPGDTIRLQFKPGGALHFQTPNGSLWGFRKPYSKAQLVRWNGKAWVDTPAKTPPHPPWRNRKGPPWMRWASYRPLIIPDGDTVLAVVVRDVYQDMQTEAAAKNIKLDDWRNIYKMAGEKFRAGQQPWWCEARLFHKGKWSGPTKLPAFIENHWGVLAAAYSSPARRPGWFALQGDADGHLWTAYNSRVSVRDRDGVKVWKIPAKAKAGMREYHLCQLPDGRMLLSQSNHDGDALWALCLKDGKILAKKFPEPDWGNFRWHKRQPPAVFVARDKGVWLTLPNATKAPIWRLGKNGWEKREDLGNLLFEDAGGWMWFMPGKGHYELSSKQRGYRVVKGEKTRTVPWPADYAFGELTPTRDGRLLAACGYRIVELSKGDDPLKRTITKVRITTHYVATSRVFEAGDGTIFANGRFGK